MIGGAERALAAITCRKVNWPSIDRSSAELAALPYHRPNLRQKPQPTKLFHVYPLPASSTYTKYV